MVGKGAMILLMMDTGNLKPDCWGKQFRLYVEASDENRDIILEVGKKAELLLERYRD